MRIWHVIFIYIFKITLYIQGDQKVSVPLIITIQKATSDV
jgi:hypothetical protein